MSPKLLIGAGAAILVVGIAVGVMVAGGGHAAPVPQQVATLPPENTPAQVEDAPVFGAAAAPAATAGLAPTVVEPTESVTDAAAVSSTHATASNGSATIVDVASSTPTAAAPTHVAVETPEPSTGPAPLRTTRLELVDLIAVVEPSVVRLNVVKSRGGGHGSGFIADAQGNVVTNYHVIDDATKAYAVFADGRQVNVKGYRFVDPSRDIAVIQLDLPPDTIAPLPVSESLPRKGEAVVAFGAPEGLDFSTSEGIISAVRESKELRETQGLDVQGTWLQTTTPISGGSSGGPLVDRAGNVVGINTMSRTVGQNLNFAISSVDITAALAQLSDVKPFRPEELKPHSKMATRDKAPDEIGTERGNKLFAATEEIFLINLARRADFDPTGRLWQSVVLHSERAVERSGVKLSFDEPATDAAVMLVFMKLKPIRGGSPGTHEMVLYADLICFDPNAPESRQYARVWHGEETVGTASLIALANGVVPNRLDSGVRKFFTKFRQARNAAINATQEKTDADADGTD